MKATTKDQRPTTKMILALDVDTFAQATYFINTLFPRVKIFKVGAQLFTACGPRIMEFIHKSGAEVFLDLKFFDIPHSVANATRQAVRQKVKMLTLHILGGEEMLKAAVAAARDEAKKIKTQRPLLIGVTILTSKETKPAEVLALAKTGLACGLDGVVCSAREAPTLRQAVKKKFIIVTPGIRPKSAQRDDQKRTCLLYTSPSPRD